MLPGFRFLFAAIVLSMSAMVFGLGAASLFRAAHEKFASMPSRQGPPVTVFTLQTEAAPPVLAMLRVEASAVEKPADAIVQGAPATEKPATVATPAEPEISAAPKPQDSPAPSEIAKPEIAKPEIAKSEVSVTEISLPAEPAPVQANAPAAAGELKIAATEPAASPPADQVASVASEPVEPEPAVTKPTVSELTAPAVSEQASQPALPAVAPAPTIIDPKVAAKIATLGGPPVAIEREPPAKVDDDNEDSVAKKRQRARRASHRRHVAARARLARQTLQPAQQPGIGFAQPAIAVGSR
ncbi:MAG TPA: hypothetical protein VJ226_16125 [Bradyrhizobium sp.]|jgi:hypothetical protein|nr:hypothetical protein [Bradyrhizobium sp.]